MMKDSLLIKACCSELGFACELDKLKIKSSSERIVVAILRGFALLLKDLSCLKLWSLI